MHARIDRVRNPFRFGGLARDEDFADRRKEVKTLTADAINGQDVVVFAPRRLGKSSLVSAVMAGLVRSDVLVADIDLWRIPTKEKLAEELAASIYSNLTSARDRAVERALAPFRGLRITPTITIDPESGAIGFSFTAEQGEPDLDATLERLLELPAELGADQGKPVVLVIDEFQEIGKIGRDLTKLMRSVFQQQSNVSHIYLGSRKHLMEAIFNDENEPFWRSAKQMELGPIPADEFAGFITRRFAETGKGIDRGLVGRILAVTDGHPYATQRLCYEVWQEAEAASAAGERELILAFDTVLESEDSHFTLIWESAASAQQLLLAALAREPGRPLTQSYRRRHRLPGASTVQRAISSLSDRELIAREDGVHRISEPFLAEWINRNVAGAAVTIPAEVNPDPADV